MGRLQITCRHLLILALCAGLSGCMGFRSPRARSSARQPAPLSKRATEPVTALTPPAPALYIPGPAPLAISPVALSKPAAHPPHETALPPRATLSLAAAGETSPAPIQESTLGIVTPPLAAAAAPPNLPSAPRDTEAMLLPTLVAAAPAQAPVAPPPASAVSPQRVLAKKAVERLADMDTYVMRLRRREMINGTLRPEEVVLCKFRSAPFSVYMKWVGKEANGREVIYVKDRHENKIHTLVAAGDVPLVPAGKYMTFPVDSILVKSNSRHLITDAGLAKAVARFAQTVERNEKGDPRAGTLKYLGPLKRPEFEAKVAGVLHTIPPGVDPVLPGGGRRLLFFDSTLNLPVLIITHDDAGQEVEYYCHDRFLIPGQLDDGDFDPSRWSKTKTK